jgi:hypothetical protein
MNEVDLCEDSGDIAFDCGVTLKSKGNLDIIRVVKSTEISRFPSVKKHLGSIISCEEKINEKNYCLYVIHAVCF